MKSTPFLISILSAALIAGCQSHPWYSDVKSKTLSADKVQAMAKRVDNLYPKADNDEKQQILDVAVRAMDNMIRVKGGSFQMGDFGMPCRVADVNRIDWDPNNHPCLTSPASQPYGANFVHPVTLSTYYLSKYKTTFKDFEIMRKAHHKPFALPIDAPIKRGSKDYSEFLQEYGLKPASVKTWQSTKDYCQWLGKITDEPFDLPTEAQWEYAARSRGKHYYYATNNNYLIYKGSRVMDKNNTFHEVKDENVNTSKSPTANVDSYYPNPLGFYGMQSMTDEYVNDWYSKTYYKKSPIKDPKGPKTGKYKVTRAGGNMPTTGRGYKPLDQNVYSLMTSFRCSVQIDNIKG